MRKNTKQMLARAGLLAAMMLAALPAGAEDAPAPGAAGPAPVTLRTWVAPRAAPTPFSQQRMSERVGEMSQQVQRDIGAIYPGEDALGTGTSITH